MLFLFVIAKSPKKMKPEGLWKAVVRRKVSLEKPLRSLQKQLPGK